MRGLVSFIVVLSTGAAYATPYPALDTARARAGDLRLSVYATAGSVVKMAESEAARAEALDAMSRLGVTRIFLEVYRGGVVVPPEQLETVRDFFEANGVGVAGGIATVPGKGFGVAANEGLAWFNFQAPETQEALARVMRQSAPLFDTFIVDDFLCTGDTSEISNAARGDRSWSQYRRDLMVQVARDVLVGPAKEAHPDIEMIIKFPQWYDLFHVFGYDVARMPALFDGVWVGTETRGATTQRYGFVQPYEGFVNYRWIAAQSGGKIRGAWFDYGDCGEHDFIDQAWQSVAAGAPELMIFSLAQLVKGHPDHARLQEDFSKLADLAALVRENPVVGAVAYKPPNSDAGDDLYIMDFIGMLGVSLVPSPVFPENADTIFLPTQAAADPEVAQKVQAALEGGRQIVMTPGFISRVPAMAAPAGLKNSVESQSLKADSMIVDGEEVVVKHGLDLSAPLAVDGAEAILEAVVGEKRVPFLTSHTAKNGRLFVLNTRTFSQADFDAVNEVLLSPRSLGLVDLPEPLAATIRRAFMGNDAPPFTMPARVTCQCIGQTGWLLQNYNEFPIKVSDGRELPARGRLLLRKSE